MNQPSFINPPKWPLKFLRFFVKRKYLEEIEGDMEKIFFDNVEQLSLKKARQIYTWDGQVIKANPDAEFRRD